MSKEEQAELGRKQEAPRPQYQLSRQYISLTLCFPWAFIVNQSGPRTVYLQGKVKVTWDEVNKETVESAFLFFTSIFKSVKIPSKPNYVSSRRKTKEGLIYYLISKYTVTSRCTEKPIHQFQKAKSTFLVIGLGIKFLCYQICAIVWMAWRCYRKMLFFWIVK